MEREEQEKRFPGNSKVQYNSIDPTKQKPLEERKPVEKVVKGAVVPKKKTLCEKFAETFLAADLKTVIRQIMFDVLVPAAKETFADMVNGATNMILFDGQKNRRITRDRDRSFVRPSVDYGGYYNDRRRDRDDGPVPISSVRKPIEDLIFTTRGDAEDVLNSLCEDLAKYEVVSVKDLYGYAGLQTDYTKVKYGWFNLENANVSRVPGGYLLKLPRPVVID